LKCHVLVFSRQVVVLNSGKLDCPFHSSA
jgi:hypothetical protein